MRAFPTRGQAGINHLFTIIDNTLTQKEALQGVAGAGLVDMENYSTGRENAGRGFAGAGKAPLDRFVRAGRERPVSVDKQAACSHLPRAGLPVGE